MKRQRIMIGRIIVGLLLVTTSLAGCKNEAQPVNIDNKKHTTMATKDFTTTFVVDQTPAAVFNAVTNPRGWWSEEIEGGTSKVNDVFNYHFKDVHVSKMKLIEVVPNRKVV